MPASGQAPSSNCSNKILDRSIADVSRYEAYEVHLSGSEAVWPLRLEAFLKSRQDVGKEAAKNELVATP